MTIGAQGSRKPKGSIENDEESNDNDAAVEEEEGGEGDKEEAGEGDDGVAVLAIEMTEPREGCKSGYVVDNDRTSIA